MQVVKNVIAFLMDILETITFVGSLFVVMYLFIMQPNQVKGPSMEPSFYTGEYIFTSKVTYKLRDYKHGDVVVFHAPDNPDQEYIKRIVGLPGDTVEVRDGTVLINNKVLNETYIAARTTLTTDGFLENNSPIVVPSGTVFVMGDNRPRSSDSREFGPIAQSSIIGQVFYRYFPTHRLGPIQNPLGDEDLQTDLQRERHARLSAATLL